MTSKAEFNAEEWSLVCEVPPLAGILVITAQRGGTLRESMSMGEAFKEARSQQGASELLDEVLGSAPQIEPTQFNSPEELKQHSLGRIREAVGLLEQKATPEEVEDYRGFVLSVAQKAAEAHKEGGFMGVGGERVSEAEQATLDEIRGALGAGQA